MALTPAPTRSPARSAASACSAAPASRRVALASAALLGLAAAAPTYGDPPAGRAEAAVTAIVPLPLGAVRAEPSTDDDAAWPGLALPTLAWTEQPEPEGGAEDPRSVALGLLADLLAEDGLRIYALGATRCAVGDLSARAREAIDAAHGFDREQIELRVRLHLPGGVEEARTRARAGAVAELASTHTARVLHNYSAELACDDSGGWHPSALGDPQLGEQVVGWRLALRAHAIPGSDDLAVEALLRWAGDAEPPHAVGAAPRFLGRLELGALATSTALGSGRVSPASPLVLHAGDGELAVRVEVFAARVGAASAPADGATFARLSTSLLTQPAWILGPYESGWGLAWAHELPHGLVLEGRVAHAAWMPHDLAAALAQDRPARIAVRPAFTDVGGSATDVVQVPRALPALAVGAARSWRVNVRVAVGGETVAAALSLAALEGRTTTLRHGRERLRLFDQDSTVG